jgi:septum formation protein
MKTVPQSVLVLASSSPRRRQLLGSLGIGFEVIEPDSSAEDGRLADETPEDYVCRLAVQKVRSAAGKITACTVIGCDTVAVCNGNILEKPNSLDDARCMLKMLRGSEHAVLSGLCVLHQTPDNVCECVRYAVTKLRMEAITDETLENYLQTGAWQGKAGAFGYQDDNDWIQIIEGSESNVVGFPLELLQEMLTY